MWAVIAALVVLVGSLGAIIGANSIDNDQSARIHKSFLTSSAEIAATLKLEIQGQQDLISSVRSFLIGDPQASQADLTAWSHDVGVFSRYKAVTEVGVINYVTAAELPAFAKRYGADQGVPFAVVPAGKRPYYCIAPIGITRHGSATLPHDLDVCATALGPLVITARRSGKSAVLPYSYDGVRTMAVEEPIYRDGSHPTTVAARERAFEAIIALTFLPKLVLANALVGHGDTAVALHYGGAHSRCRVHWWRVTGQRDHDGEYARWLDHRHRRS